MKARVLDVVRGYFFFSLDFDADVKSDCARNGAFVRAFLQIVPLDKIYDIHEKASE